MAGNFEDFLSFIHTQKADNPKAFLQYFISYCQKQFPTVTVSLYQHRYTPSCFTHLSGEDCLPANLQDTLHKHNDTFYRINNRWLSLIQDDKNFVRYILLLTPDNQAIDNQLLSIIDMLKIYLKQIYHQIDQIKRRQAIFYANLISQLTHDFTTILNQAERSKINISNRPYAENMLKQLLFYIRDIDLERSRLPAAEYMNACIGEINKPDAVEISISVSKTLDTILIDAELFTKALTNIINNAIEAGQNGKNKISIDVYALLRESPFIKHDWIVFNVSDSGSGIPADYLSMVKNPFFTTRKTDGHCGLGLTIAEKIIEAHEGAVTIKNNDTGKGITCLIYLPDK
jgi:signal transduction histidine kinase